MKSGMITKKKIEEFEQYLKEKEKADLTVKKYLYEIHLLMEYLKGCYRQFLNKQCTVHYSAADECIP